MADTTALKNRVRAAIKANDNQEITGPVLQQALLDIVDELNRATETEANARQSGDSTLQQGINTERQRAEGAESTLQQAITTEKNRAEGAEQTLNQAINTNKNSIDTINAKIGDITNVESTIQAGSGTQYLLQSYSIDEKVIYIKIAGTAQFSANLYYNFQFNDGTYTGEKRISADGKYVKFDADTKKYKTLAIYAPASIITQGGSCTVTILTESIVKDILFLQGETNDLNEDVEQLGQSIIAEKNRAEGAEQTLQQSIISINNKLNSGYIYAGIATPETEPAQSTGQKVFYIATQAGTYTNFLLSENTPITFNKKGVYIIASGNSNYWSLDIVQQIDDTLITGSNNPTKGGAVKTYVNERTIKEDGNIILFYSKCYDENGNLKNYTDWFASALINIDEVLNDSIILSQAANGNEGANISSVVFYNSSNVKIGNLFTGNVSSVAKSSMPSGTKYVAFSFYNKNSVTIQDYSYDSRISKLNGLINTNKNSIDTINAKIGDITNVESTIQTGSGIQYLLQSYSIDEKVIYIKIAGTAQFSANLYYNFQFNDGTYTGEKRISADGKYVKFDADTKKYKTLAIYAPASIITQGGSCTVTILTESIVKDILFLQDETNGLSEDVEQLKEEVYTIENNPEDKWESDNLWDANHLFNGYLMTNSDTGVPIANGEWRMTNYLIPVIVGAKVYLRKIGTTTNCTFSVAEYNSNQEYIKRDSNKQQSEYTVPSGVAYIKISVYKGHVNNGQDYPNFPLYSYQNYREHYLTGDKNPPFGVYPNLRMGAKLQGKRIAYFGDSIIGFGSVAKYLKNYVGAAEVYNVGFGGCRMAHHDTNYGKFSMYKLAEAIVSGDYSAQIAALPNTSLGLNGTLSLNNLTTIDWSTIDMIIIHYGSNDWTSGVINIGTGDTSDEYDFKGMAELSVQTILTTYPKIKIAFDTILWRDVTTIPSEVTGTDFLTATNRKGNTPADFNNAIKEVCAKYYLDCNDLTFGLFNSYNKTTYLQDSSHPNDRGWQLMAEKVANLL